MHSSNVYVLCTKQHRAAADGRSMMTDETLAERTTLAALYADLRSRRDDLDATLGNVRARLLELGSGPAGPLRVTVQPVRRLDEAAFAAKYGPDEFPGYYSRKPITQMAKALGDDSVYVDGTPQLRVVEVD